MEETNLLAGAGGGETEQTDHRSNATASGEKHKRSPTSPRRRPNDAVMVRGGIYYLTLGLSIARTLLVTASALLPALTCICSSATVVQPNQVRHVLSLSLLRPELDDGPLHPLVVAHVADYSFSDPKSQLRRCSASHLEEGVGLGTDRLQSHPLAFMDFFIWVQSDRLGYSSLTLAKNSSRSGITNLPSRYAISPSKAGLRQTS